MPIRPTTSGTEKTGTERLRQTTPSVPARLPDHASGVPTDASLDHLEVSSVALELNAQLAANRDTPLVSAPRLREVLLRLTNGWYDRPEIRDQILSRLAKDLGA